MQISKILVVGTDEVLLSTRVSILGQEYTVSAAAPDQALVCLQAEAFNLLLVCTSTPFEVASILIREAHRAYPHLCIVRLLTPDRDLRTKPVAHAVVTIDYHPEAWLKAIRRLLTPGQTAAFA